MFVLVYLKGKEVFRQKDLGTIEDARKCIYQGNWKKFDSFKILEATTNAVVEEGRFKSETFIFENNN